MLPFGYPIYLLFAVLVTIIGAWHKLSKDAKELIVLGPLASGKTLWLCFLRNVEYKNAGTFDRESFPPFTFKKKNGDSIKIKSGYDYGGQEENIKLYYEQAICTSTPKAVMFFFSIYDYLNNDSYKRDVIARLGFIENKFRSQLDNDNFYLVISYADKVSDYKNKAKEITNELKQTHKLTDLLSKANIMVINATNKSDLENLKNKMNI
ncbi:hypothetical protein EII14_06365 [Alloprevotella sp. OH1205_COT-284]|uniref:hypothetical protein n=1 Tax=Alloprevotella sp. OH1205_COT-284 TaxID=2491043 RepID=UPI000F5EC393|nr:hypothetical protein [Alloprevotella sp. OH1205_COT-284]RRD79336.1 hypothetical protein EII14_06365 [Alloprevotella sp. OH1205_COT-284]